MAGGVPTKGKRSLNLNLVPFVDLFSTLIIFLISTAVWDQLAAIKTSMGAQDRPSMNVPKEDIKKIKSDVKVTVTDKSVEMFDAGRTTRFQKNGDQWDFTQLEEFFTAMRAKYPEKLDMLLISSDEALYEDVVAVMDRSMAQNFREIIVTGNEGK